MRVLGDNLQITDRHFVPIFTELLAMTDFM